MLQRLPRYLVSGLVGLLSIFGLTQSFFYGDVIQNSLKRVFPFRVDPSFTGGDPLAVFIDPPGDDNGAGTLLYPLNGTYAEPHTLDLVSYTVREPQSGVLWSAEEDYWQLDLRFGRLANGPEPFAGISARIYIDLDGDGKGSSVPLYESENIRFHPAWPWDIAVEINGLKQTALIHDATGAVIGRANLYPSPGRRTLSVRIPLKHSPAAVVLSRKPTRHYVTVTGLGLYDEGQILPVKTNAGKNAGGGALSYLTPPLYDLLVPEGKSQGRILSAFDEESGRSALLYPLTVTGTKAIRSITGTELAAELPPDPEEKSLPDPDTVDDPLWKGIILYGLGREEEAEELLRPLTDGGEPSPLALAYTGAIIARRGGEASNPAEAMEIVWESYRYLDRAVELSTGADRLHALNCRAAVSLAIPEGVFGKSASGMADCDEIAWLCLDMGDRAGAAEAWKKAARGAERAGLPEEQRLYHQLSVIVNY